MSLKFAQICKLLLQDGGFIQYSTDGGSNWQIISNAYYRGSGIFTIINKFSENCYPTLWMPGDTLTKPNNSWWTTEVFDLSTLVANQADVKLRFCIADGANVGGEGRYGWLLDDIKVLASNNEIDPPIMSFKTPILKDTLFVTGPFTAQAYVKDSSAISSVNLYYSINGGAEIMTAMTNISDSTYTVDIPSIAYNNSVCYRIVATDIYNNQASLPSGGCQSFLILKGDSVKQVGTTTTSGYNSPIYIASSTSTYLYSYSASIYKKSEILSGGVIKSLAFYKNDAQGYNLNNASLRIYLKNVSTDYTPNTYLDYVSAKSGAIKVYESNAQNLNLSTGWQTFNFNTSLFSYPGNENLMVFVEWYRPGNATGAVNWQYNTSSGQASIFYGAASTPDYSNTTGQRANIKINFQTSNKNYDASILNFASPQSTLTANTNVPVSVRVKNLGLVTMTKVKVKWSLDGVYQGVQNWTGSLPQDFVSLPLTLGNINVNVGPHLIKAWTEMPNDSIDQDFTNDTTVFNVFACQNLTGVYTVGNATANFPTFADVYTALTNCGISGPVTFKIKSGTYTQQMALPYINNVSDINTITFESESGNKNDVIIQYNAAGTGDNYVVKLDGTKYIIIKNITIKSLNATYGRVVELANGAEYNTLQGCKLDMMPTTTSTVSGIYNASSTYEHHNKIIGNEINGGYYGIYFYGASATKETGNVFEGNIINGFYYYGLYAYYQDSASYIGNTISNPVNTTAYGLYSYYNDNAMYLKNKIFMNAATTNYCMYLAYNNSSAGNSLVANNFVSQSVGTSTVYGIYNTSSNRTKYLFNSVYVTGGTTSAYTFYVSGTSGIVVKNNIFCNTNGGYAYYASSTAAIDSSDYNDIYSTGSNFAYWGGVKANLASFQTASLKDANSISINPLYYANNDLHTDNVGLFGKGEYNPLVTDDIDGQNRAAVPCIGADEFTALATDAKLKSLYTYGKLPMNSGTPHQVVSIVKNMGFNTLTNLNVSLDISGNNTFSNVKTIATLLPSAEDTVVFDAFTPTTLGLNNVKVSLPVDDNIADNELNYRQEITNDMFAYADTAAPTTFLGFNTGSGLFVAKYKINGNKLISKVRAYITNSNTIGQRIYAVVLNQNGNLVDTSASKIITAADTNTWVSFTMLNPSASSVTNNFVYVGIAQTPSTPGYYPLGCQKESPTRKASFYYTTTMTGGSLTETTQFGRFMIQADLISPSNDDARLVEILSPNTNCGLTNETVKIKIQNAGLNLIDGTQNTLTAYYAIKAGNGLTNIISQQVMDTITPLQTKEFTFSTPLNMQVGSTDSIFKIIAWVELLNDNIHINDSVLRNVKSMYTPQPPVVTSPVNVAIGNTTTLNVISNDTVNWYANINDTVSFATGNSYTTPPIFTSKTYYVSASRAIAGGSGGTQFVGPANTSIGAGGTISATSYVTYFDVMASSGVNIVNVDLYPATSGTAFVMFIKNSSDAIIQSYSGVSTTTGTKQTVNVNFQVPQGSGYKLGFSSGPSFYRNTAGASYPYTIPNVISITGNSFNNAAYYYNAYNWEVSVIGGGSATASNCSSSRVPIVVNAIPGVDALVSEIITPKTGCNLMNQTVKVKIRNKGNLPIINGQNGLTANYGLILNGNIINVVNENVIDTVKAFDSVYFTFITPLNLPVGAIDSNYKIVAWTNVQNDLNPNNDTTFKSVISKHIPLVPTVTTPVNINFGSTASLNAVSPDTIVWYAHINDTIPIFKGANFVTPILYDTTTYWASATTMQGSNTNLALAAVASHSGGGASPTYGPDMYNDGNIPAYGSGWGWTSTNGWIEYTWTTPKTFNKVVFYKDNRPMSTCTFQYWNGSTYVDFYNYNNAAVEDSVTFPAVTSVKIRFNTIAGSSNPNFREIQVFESMIPGCQSPLVAVKVNVAPGSDASVSQIISPSTGCGLTNQAVKVRIKNKGNLPILGSQNALTAYYGLKLNGNLINIVSQPVPNNIPDFDSTDFTFNTLLSLPAPTADSNYTLVAWTNLVNDLNINNDTTTKAVKSNYTPAAPTVSNVSVNFGSTATFNVTTNDSLYWFANVNDTIPIASGNQFTTAALYDTTTYYVVAGQANTSSGISYVGEVAPLSSAGTGGGLTTYVNFTALANCTLKTVDLFPSGSGPGTVTIELRTSSGTPIMSQTFNVNGNSSPLSAAQTVTLNFPLTAGTSYRLGVNAWTGGVTNLYRDLTGTYPYVLPGLLSIDSPSLTPYFYFFYHWGITTGSGASNGCTSSKVPATAIVTNIPSHDVAATSVTEPLGSITSGIATPVKVKITNYGFTTLTTANIKWSVNGVVQPNTVPWTGSLISGQTSAAIYLGDYTFPGGPSVIKAWTSSPNGMTDMYPLNDTVTSNVMGCLTGLFTIGTGGTFPTFTAALNAINTVGICGNVIFDVIPGTYNESLTINQIANSSPNNTIKFRSQNGNNTSVILTTATGNSVIKLNAADYISFEKMTIKATAAVPTTVELSGGADNNVFDGNIIELASSSASANRVINSTSTALDNYNKFLNNTISGGYYGVYWYGSSSLRKLGNKFINNTIKDFYYYGLYIYYNDSVTATANTITNASNSGTVYGLYSYYTNSSIYTKNKIYLNGTGTNYGLDIYYNNSTGGGSSLVANNFVSQSVGTGVYGIYNYYSQNINYYFNSVNVTGGSTSYYAFYSTGGSNNNVVNNIFSNTGGGYAYYISTAAGINTSNYNDFYATGTNLAYWTSAHTSLATLKTASGKDQNSISVNPNFFSLTDLHMVNFDIDGRGTPITSINEDIDGDIRSATVPDIGADEFDLPNYDAGIIAITQPNSPVSAGLQTVKFVIKNFGLLNLTSANIFWKVNGVMQAPQQWTGNLALGAFDTVIMNTQYNFLNGISVIKAWSELPSGFADQLNMNDTLNASLVTCNGPLTGNYSIGGASADYSSINDAVLSLISCGISAPVIFNINPGNYYEQIRIPMINGASETNTITFKSLNNDSTSVAISYTANTSTANYVVKFDGAKYVKIKYVSIINTTQNNLGRVVELANSASNNEISNCVIQSVISTTSTTAGIYSYNTKDERNTFANNLITGGYYGIYLYGVGSAAGSKEIGNTILNNIVKDFYYYGLYLYYQDSITVIGNTITNGANSGTTYGMYSYYADNNNYRRNKILLNNSSTTYGMYLYYNNNAGGNGIVANNFISQSVGTGTVYGVYSSTSSNIKHYYNSINVTLGGTSYNMYFTGGSGNILRNNSSVNKGSGYAIYASSTTSISSSNYNNFYTNNTNFAYWGGAASTLAAWQTLSGKDSSSVSGDPDYISVTDLHVYTPFLNNIGTAVPEVTIDIDGQSRSLTTPDIGADEYSPLPVDLAVTSILEPVNAYSQIGSTVSFKIRIKNMGADSLGNFQIVYKAGNSNPVSQLYSNYLLSNKVDTVLLNTPYTVGSGPVSIKFYANLVNDGNHYNDTAVMNYFGVPVKNIPYAENFDGTTEEWFQTGGTAQWQKGVPTASVINSAHSAPNVWATVLNGNYADASASYLYTPIFNNSVLKADTLKFWMWMDAENDYDGGKIEYSNNGGADWNLLGTLNDTNSTNWYNGTSQAIWTGNGTGWKQVKYAVSKIALLGNFVQFRYMFISNANTNFNGWAIDDFELTLKQIPFDASVISINTPASTSKLGDTVRPLITVKNNGLSPLTSIPVSYTVDGQTPVSEIFNTNLAPGATANYEFVNYFKVLSSNSYTIKAYTSVAGDYYNTTDTATKTVNVIPALYNVGVTSIISPPDTVFSGNVITVTIKIKNFGSTPLTSIPVAYQRGSTSIQNATWTGAALNMGDSAIFSFPVTFTVALGSSFSFWASTLLPNDAYTFNDKISKTIIISQLPGNATSITSNTPGTYGGDTICFPTGATSSISAVYTVAVISSASKYVWKYTGTNVSYTDTTLSNSVTLNFSPNATDGNLTVYGINSLGNGAISPALAIDVIQNCTIGIEEDLLNNLWLGQNMPNPANGNTIIEFNLPQQAVVNFEVVNLLGQMVYNFNETKDSGKHIINLNVNDLPDGVYYYSLSSKGKRLVKKMIINK